MVDISKMALVLGLTVLASFLLSGLPAKFRLPSTNYSIEVTRDLLYYQGPGFSPEKHRLDVYRPVGVDGAPVLFFVHGGSWWISDKENYQYVGKTFAGRGIVTVVISYRLSPAVKHPEHVQDVARAFHWVVENIANFDGDPGEIFVGGHSAGAHLSALMALDDEYLDAEGLSNEMIRGVISLSGVFDLNAILGFTEVFSDDHERRRLASPIAYVDKTQPPFLLIYADREFPTLAGQAGNMYAKLQEQHSEVVLEKIANTAHLKLIWDIGTLLDPTTELICQFIEGHLLVSR